MITKKGSLEQCLQEACTLEQISNVFVKGAQRDGGDACYCYGGHSIHLVRAKRIC